MDNKLKACPFCGCEDIRLLKERADAAGTIWHYYLCYGCRCSSGHYPTNEKAKAAWNRRINEQNSFNKAN